MTKLENLTKYLIAIHTGLIVADLYATILRTIFLRSI